MIERDRSWATVEGDGLVAMTSEVLRCLVGSTAHGLNVQGSDDRDEMGVYVQPPSVVIGNGRSSGSALLRTARPNERSHHGDVDLMLYSLRRYVALATDGNPSILVPLFVTGDAVLHCTAVGEALREHRYLFVSRRGGLRFRGYAQAQRDRLTGGGKRNRVPSRPDIVERYGYDTKYAMHALRLTLQGIELMQTGSLSLPMSASDREQCMAVRTGQVTYDEAVARVDSGLWLLDRLLDNDAPWEIPAEPDRDAVDDLLVSLHRRAWGL